MERKCSQSIKVPFPIKVFYGTDVVVNIPRAGNMIKNIRLVVDFQQQNTLGERVLEKAEFLNGSDDEILETVYGEFIHVENSFKVPIEKADKLDDLLCTTSPGRFYMKLPFQITNDEGFFIFDTPPKIRLLFNNLNENVELSGAFLMIDYYVTENVPKTPYVQKIKQVQRFTSAVDSVDSVNMHVYAVGSVYELFFTVKDVSTGEYVDAINNVTLFFGEKERFNLSGYYLRYIEPMKRYGTHLVEPMYMYSFCHTPHVTNIPSGSTHFHENSFFKIDLLGNTSQYEITVWAQSHNFVYQKEESSKLMFKSTEMVLDTTTSTLSTSGGGVPLRVSYTDFAGSATVYYSSPYEVSNVSVITDAPYYTVTQDSIIFQKIDSLFTEYSANVTFSSRGFSDTTCYFKFRGSGMYLDKMVYSSVGNWPTHIDQGQNFHYILDNTFDTSNVIFNNTSIQTFTIDENKNYSFTTYVPSTVTTNGFTGPGSIVTAYDQDMSSTLYTLTSQNSNVCAPASNVAGFYGYDISVNGYTVPTLHQGVIVNRDTGVVNYFNAGSTSKVYVDNLDVVSTYVIASVRVESSSTNFVASGTTTTSFGNGSARTALVKISNGVPSFLSVLSSADMSPKTDVHVNREGKCIWAYAYTSSSSLSNPPNTYSTSGGYSIGKFDILTGAREWNVNVACTPSTLDMKLVVGATLENSYVVAGYTEASTPTLTGFTFNAGNGFMVLKINNAGVVKFALSFIGSVTEINPILDSVTGKFMISVKKSSSGSFLKMYNNGAEKYSDVGLYQFFIFDDYGNINSSAIDLNQYFSIPKPLYFLPPTNSVYFKNNNEIPDNDYWIVNYSLLSMINDKSNYLHVLSDFGYYKSLVRISPDAGVTSTVNYAYLTNVVSGFITTYDNYIYAMCSVYSGTTVLTVGTQSYSFVSASNSILVFKFNIDGTFTGVENTVSVDASTGSTLSVDKDGNLYICGYSSTTTLKNIKINGATVGNIPVTIRTYTAFVIKITKLFGWGWVAYVDGGFSSFTSYPNLPFQIESRVSCTIDSNLRVCMSGFKETLYAIIKGGTQIPATVCQSSVYAVLFDSSGNFANWYTYMDCVDISSNRTYPISVKFRSDNGLYAVLNQGRNNNFNASFPLYVNNNGTVTTTNILKLRETSGCILYFDSSLVYTWNVRFGTSGAGNWTSISYAEIDDANNIIISGYKQTQPSNIVNTAGTVMGQIPATVEDGGVIFKVNSDGTYTGYHGLVDSVGSDISLIVIKNVYGDFFMNAQSGSSVMFIFDKNGYVTSTQYYYSIIKYNANFTMNKISL